MNASSQYHRTTHAREQSGNAKGTQPHIQPDELEKCEVKGVGVNVDTYF